MFNPLIDVSLYTDTQIEEKITDLQRKYFQTQNQQLQQQIAVILEMYKSELSMRQEAAMKKLNDDNDNGLDDLINIS